MYALRERRVHVTQEDFELAVAKVHINWLLFKYIFLLGYEKRFEKKYFIKKTLDVIRIFVFLIMKLIEEFFIVLKKKIWKDDFIQDDELIRL